MESDTDLWECAIPEVPGKQAYGGDEQGNSSTCTHFSLSKCLVNGYWERKFTPKRRMDFLQSDVKTALLNVMPVRFKRCYSISRFGVDNISYYYQLDDTVP